MVHLKNSKAILYGGNLGLDAEKQSWRGGQRPDKKGPVSPVKELRFPSEGRSERQEGFKGGGPGPDLDVTRLAVWSLAWKETRLKGEPAGRLLS